MSKQGSSLPCLALFLPCLVLPCLVLSCLVLALPCLVLCCFVLSWLGLAWLVSSFPVSSRLVSSFPVSSRLVSSRLVSCSILPFLVLSCGWLLDVFLLTFYCVSQYTCTTSSLICVQPLCFQRTDLLFILKFKIIMPIEPTPQNQNSVFTVFAQRRCLHAPMPMQVYDEFIVLLH